MKSLALLAGVTLLVWAVLLVPGWLLWPEAALLHSGVAVALCLLPALGTLGWAVVSKATPESQLMVVMGGTGIRLIVSLGGGALLYYSWPEVFPKVFWLWVAVFYFLTLALEVGLILRMNKSLPSA